MPGKYETSEATRARSQYGSIMEEIKRRNRAMMEMLSGTVPPQPQIIVSEFCYLQLRMMCELIVMACAIAHGDVAGVRGKKVQKEWNAAGLAAKLEQLHPDFYPVPGRQVIGANGRPERIETVQDGFLTLSDLRVLYAECGDHLHVGNIRALLSGSRPSVDLERVRAWQDKIVQLLNHHQIQLSDPNYQLWTLMQAKEDGRVRVTLFQRVEPTPK